MLGHAVLSSSPVAFLSHCSVVLAVVPSPTGAAVAGSGSCRRGVVTFPATSPPHVPGDSLGAGAASEVGGSDARIPLPSAAGLPVVFVLSQTQSRSCASEQKKQQARKRRNPNQGGAIGNGK